MAIEHIVVAAAAVSATKARPVELEEVKHM
jgi:hypothetical protein